MKLRLAGLQTPGHPGEVEENLHELDMAAHAAVSGGADILVTLSCSSPRNGQQLSAPQRRHPHIFWEFDVVADHHSDPHSEVVNHCHCV